MFMSSQPTVNFPPPSSGVFLCLHSEPKKDFILILNRFVFSQYILNTPPLYGFLTLIDKKSINARGSDVFMSISSYPG